MGPTIAGRTGVTLTWHCDKVGHVCGTPPWRSTEIDKGYVVAGGVGWLVSMKSGIRTRMLVASMEAVMELPRTLTVELGKLKQPVEVLLLPSVQGVVTGTPLMSTLVVEMKCVPVK